MKKQLRLITALAFLLGITSCEEILFEDDISEMQVQLLAPALNAEIASNSIRFDWQLIEGASTYRIQVATPTFENASQFVFDSELDTTTAEIQLNPGNYQWRVKGLNGGYETAYTTGTFTVVVPTDFSQLTVILTGPEDGRVTNEVNQQLSWQSLDGATLYRVQTLEDGNLLSEETTTALTLPVLFNEGDFVWQVRAENGTQNTLYTSNTLLVDTTAPNVPDLLSPTDGNTLSTSEISFEWSREDIPGSVESDSLFIYRDVDLTDLVLADQVSMPFSTTLTNDTYYWLMKASDEAGNESADSAVFSFTVND